MIFELRSHQMVKMGVERHRAEVVQDRTGRNSRGLLI